MAVLASGGSRVGSCGAADGLVSTLSWPLAEELVLTLASKCYNTPALLLSVSPFVILHRIPHSCEEPCACLWNVLDRVGQDRFYTIAAKFNMRIMWFLPGLLTKNGSLDCVFVG